MLESRPARFGLAIVLLLAAGIVYYRLNRPTPLPGAGRAAEIILPDTRERFPIEWDKVFAMKPRQDPFNGAWMVNYPVGTDKWAYVVNKGAPDPTPPPPD